MTKLILVPGLLCTKQLFANQIKALGEELDIEVANITGLNNITAMAEKIILKQDFELVNQMSEYWN